MMHRIYKLSENAIAQQLDWDTAIAAGEIETVEEFFDYESAVDAFESDGYDADLYGVE